MALAPLALASCETVFPNTSGQLEDAGLTMFDLVPALLEDVGSWVSAILNLLLWIKG